MSEDKPAENGETEAKPEEEPKAETQAQESEAAEEITPDKFQEAEGAKSAQEESKTENVGDSALS